jgi:hypothetical protein
VYFFVIEKACDDIDNDQDKKQKGRDHVCIGNHTLLCRKKIDSIQHKGASSQEEPELHEGAFLL